jgi:hypothetical protein
MKVYKHEYKSATVYSTVGEDIKIIYVKYKPMEPGVLQPSKKSYEYMVKKDHDSKYYANMTKEDYEFLLERIPEFLV